MGRATGAVLRACATERLADHSRARARNLRSAARMIPVVVPVKNEWHLTARLLNSLKDQPSRVLIIDNGGTDETAREVRRLQNARSNYTSRSWTGRLQRTYRPGWSVYQMWNHGFEWARYQRGPNFYALMVNNDVVLPSGALDALMTALRVWPDAWVSYPD